MRQSVCAFLLGILGCNELPPQTGHQDTGVDTTATDSTPDAESKRPGGPLVLGDDWRIARAEEDPFSDPLSTMRLCGQESYREEYGGIEVDTGLCEHISLSQPSLLRLEVGDPLRVVGWHSNLFASDLAPATGRIALAIGPQVVWEAMVSIPAEADAWDARFESPVSAPTGTPITLYVQNHGANTWNILSFEREGPL